MKIAKKTFKDKGASICYEVGAVDPKEIEKILAKVTVDPYLYPIDISHFKALEVTAEIEKYYPTVIEEYSGRIANRHVAPAVPGGLVVIPTAWPNDRYLDDAYKNPASLGLLPDEIEKNVDAATTMDELIAIVFDAATVHKTIELEDIFPVVFKSGNETCIGIETVIDDVKCYAYYRPTGKGSYQLQEAIRRHE